MWPVYDIRTEKLYAITLNIYMNCNRIKLIIFRSKILLYFYNCTTTQHPPRQAMNSLTSVGSVEFRHLSGHVIDIRVRFAHLNYYQIQNLYHTRWGGIFVPLGKRHPRANLWKRVSEWILKESLFPGVHCPNVCDSHLIDCISYCKRKFKFDFLIYFKTL